MTTIGSQGLVDDGSSNLTVTGLTATGATAMLPLSVTGSNFAVLPGPGFFQIPVTGSAGQGSFTGSLPSPAAYPGGEILITDTIGTYPYLITGSMSLNVSGALGSLMSLSSSNGTKLSVTAGGTVGFWSDSKGWLVSAVSGTLTLKP